MSFETLYEFILTKNITLPVNHNSINLKGEKEEYDFDSLFNHNSVEDESGSISNKESKENKYSNKGDLKQNVESRSVKHRVMFNQYNIFEFC